jgi:cardiolipin synthase
VSQARARRYLTVPNFFTVLRVALLPVILWAILEERYDWALWMSVAAGISDFLDGFLARKLHQKSAFGMYLDPIADKLLLSSSFLALSLTQQMPWPVTGLILARDLAIIVTAVVLVNTTVIRKFPPSVTGKLNTFVQLGAIYVVLGDIVYRWQILRWARWIATWLVPALVIASGLHYSYLMVRKITAERKLNHQDTKAPR